MARAPTKIHAAVAAMPTRPARRRPRGRDGSATRFRPAFGAADGRAPAGGTSRGRWRAVGPVMPRVPGAPAAARRSGSAQSASGTPPAPVPPRGPGPPASGATAEPAATTGTTTREREVSAWRRNGAQTRHAASTRFQQSGQHADPHEGQSRNRARVTANASRSRPHRSQNWISRSTVHSAPGAVPRRMRHLVTIAPAARDADTTVVPPDRGVGLVRCRGAPAVPVGSRRPRPACCRGPAVRSTRRPAAPRARPPRWSVAPGSRRRPAPRRRSPRSAPAGRPPARAPGRGRAPRRPRRSRRRR